jgi:hypothetical protein
MKVVKLDVLKIIFEYKTEFKLSKIAFEFGN